MGKVGKTGLLLIELDKKIKEANSGMRVASPSVLISLTMAMSIRRELEKMLEQGKEV